MRFRYGLLFLFPLLGLAQVIKQDSVYKVTATDQISNNPAEVLDNTTLLLAQANTPEDKIHVLLLQSRAHQQFGVRDEAVASLKQVYVLAKQAGIPQYITVANLRLSMILRESGFLSLAKLYLAETMASRTQFTQSEMQHELDYFIHSEQAQYAFLEGRTNDAIALLRQSQLYLRDISSVDKRLYLHALSDRHIAQNYLKAERYTDAEQILATALRSLSSTVYKANPLRGLIHADMARTALALQQYDLAIPLLQEAWAVAEMTNHFELQKYVLQTLVKEAQPILSQEQLVYFHKLTVELMRKEEVVVSRSGDKILQLVQQDHELLHSKHRKVLRVIALSIFLSIGVYLLISWTSNTKKKMKEKTPPLPTTPASLPPLMALVDKPMEQQQLTTEESQEDKPYLPPETELTILERLKDFERSTDFLQKDLRLTTLSVKIGVNHRYLSHVINTHKRMDFASYVNALRIQYITEYLQRNPEALQYKISYLAEMSGFASHSRFTITFKRITGMSPSDYMQGLKDKSGK